MSRQTWARRQRLGAVGTSAADTAPAAGRGRNPRAGVMLWIWTAAPIGVFILQTHSAFLLGQLIVESHQFLRTGPGSNLSLTEPQARRLGCLGRVCGFLYRAFLKF